MKLVLLGPPGAGKGTQAEVLSEKFGIPHVSTGDILREAVRNNSDIGIKAKGYMDRGELVPDDIVTEIVVERLLREDAKKGFILDGYPRTKKQAESLSKALETRCISIDKVIYFKTSMQTIISRLTGRRICPKCNAIYHIKNNPPLKDNICDKCGSTLYQRNDDKEETIIKRLEVFNKTAKDLIDYYNGLGVLQEVSGDLEVSELFNIIKGILEKEETKKY